MMESMLPIAKQIGVNAPMLLYNGSLIYDHNTDETIYAPQIEYDVAMKIAETARDLGVYIQVYPGKDYFCDYINDYTRAYAKSIAVDPIEVKMPITDWMLQHPSGMQKMLVIDTPEGATRAQSALREAVPHGACFLKSKAHYVEIVPENVDKGKSLQKLGEHLGISRDEIMAFGDGENDIEMLKFAGIGVAMGNADDRVKESADYVTDSVDDDGIIHALKALNILE
jgi:Cof subfamily protein (haloacid dehalogenase superfamily)